MKRQHLICLAVASVMACDGGVTTPLVDRSEWPLPKIADGASGPLTDASINPDGGPRHGANQGVTINEFQARGEDWFEIYNSGPDTAFLAGWLLADAGDNGLPNLSNAAPFPADTEMASGTFILVMAGAAKNKEETGIWRTECGEAEDDTSDLDPNEDLDLCLATTWELSNTQGDTIFLLRADATIAGQATVPAESTDPLRSWARLPDGDGNFGAGTPTPAAPNMPWVDTAD